MIKAYFKETGAFDLLGGKKRLPTGELVNLDLETYVENHHARVQRGARNRQMRYDSGKADLALRKF